MVLEICLQIKDKTLVGEAMSIESTHLIKLIQFKALKKIPNNIAGIQVMGYRTN